MHPHMGIGKSTWRVAPSCMLLVCGHCLPLYCRLHTRTLTLTSGHKYPHSSYPGPNLGICNHPVYCRLSHRHPPLYVLGHLELEYPKKGDRRLYTSVLQGALITFICCTAGCKQNAPHWNINNGEIEPCGRPIVAHTYCRVCGFGTATILLQGGKEMPSSTAGWGAFLSAHPAAWIVFCTFLKRGSSPAVLRSIVAHGYCRVGGF